MPLMTTLAAAAVRAFRAGQRVLTAPARGNNATAQNTVAGATLSITKPTGVVDGNLLVSIVASNAGAARTWTPDTGWTERLDENAEPNIEVATKVASSEGASYTFTESASTDKLGGIIINYATAVFDVIGAVSSPANPPVAPSITVSNANSVVLAIFMNSSQSIAFTTPAGWTLVATDVDGTNGPSYIICEKSFGAGATGTVSSTPSGAPGTTLSKSVGVLLALGPN